ncbi:MAG: hypothetical protein AAF628_36060 [Planctomycetota bacterium]
MASVHRAAVAFSAVALSVVPAGCARRDHGVALPEFAAALSGRSAVVLWADAGPVPPAVAQTVAAFAAALDLAAPQREGDAIAYGAPSHINVGWPSLSASLLFSEALDRAEAPAAWFLYLDLQLVSEAALARLADLAPETAHLQSPLLDALSLQSLRWLFLAGDPNADRVTARGVVATSGTTAGLPGLLTVPPTVRPTPVAAPWPDDPQARLWLRAMVAPAVLQRMSRAVRGRDLGGDLFAGAAASSLGVLDRVVDRLDGAVRAAVDRRGRPTVAFHVRDEDVGGNDPPLGGRLPVRDGWLVLGPGEPDGDPPPDAASVTEPKSATGPWLQLLLRPAADSDTGRGLRVQVVGRSRDRAAVEVQLPL